MLETMRTIRKAKGMTMKELGEKVGVAEVTVSFYETGKREPSLEVLCKIADELDVSLDMLVRGKEKDRHDGRSLDSLMKEYRSKSPEELEYFAVMLQAVIADKRFQDHLRQDGKETP